MDQLKVLVIEDRESDFLFLHKQLVGLKNWNINVLSAKSFNEAKETIASQPIDIILLDYYIDDMKADNFLSEIQLFREYVPVVLFSGREIDNIKVSLLETKVDDFISMSEITQPLLSRIINYCVTRNRERLIAKTQKEKYNSLFHNSHEAIFTASEDYIILSTNKSFRELIQFDITNNFDFRALFIEDDYDNYFTALSAGLERKIRRTKLKRADGKILDTYVTISRILSEVDIACYQVVINDITELEELQHKMYESEKTELIQRMARIIGHEVRNPLTNILLATEEMKHDFAKNEDAVMMLDMVHRNSKRISTLIDNFLNNTRTSDIKKEKIPLESILKKSIDHCKDRFILKDIEFEINGINNETEIYVDVEKIEIVFTNIIINATEALDRSTNPKLKISLQNMSESIKVIISDNGIGMSEDVKKNLFSPFFSNKQGGLGLGMSNSKNMLSAHNAIINFESEEGVGTTFEIEFPLN